jgi:hypothetical protein
LLNVRNSRFVGGTPYSYLVKKGDLKFPVRWDTKFVFKDGDYFEREENFDINDYEYLIIPCHRMEKALDPILRPYGIDIEGDMKNFFKIEELPGEVMDDLIELITSEDYKSSYPEEFLFFEGCQYEIDGTIHDLMVQLPPYIDGCLDDLADEVTDEFLDEYIVEAYERYTEDNKCEHLIKVDKGFWYKYYPEELNQPHMLMERLWEDEIDLNVYTPIEFEPRDVPVREQRTDSSEKYLDEKTEFDFYFSEKGLYMGLIANERRYNTALINDEITIYTEMVFKGEKPSSTHEDLIHLGVGKLRTVEHHELPYEEMLGYSMIMGIKHRMEKK